jgi:hypothetical protein
MDVRRPKPVRDWRELLGESVTIVIGVLIALAAEANGGSPPLAQ